MASWKSQLNMSELFTPVTMYTKIIITLGDHSRRL